MSLGGTTQNYGVKFTALPFGSGSPYNYNVTVGDQIDFDHLPAAMYIHNTCMIVTDNKLM